MSARFRLLLPILIALSCLRLSAAPPAHDQFHVAVYIPVGAVEQMKDPAWLESSWKQISSQVKVDKVYIETYRSGLIADDALIERVKKFFLNQGVEVAGGIAYVGGGDNAGRVGNFKETQKVEPGQFISLCYTDPAQRDLVKKMAELTARHFNEIILDDFFFYNTKTASDIAAKGDESWTSFRLRTMDKVAQDLVVNAARSVNPNVKVIIKFPNWYEHFQANGYDLDQEPKIFNGIYTGTETRDPIHNDQHLQQYESYEIIRYFDNIAPGRNGGGWVDTYGTLYLDRYAEQLWDTMLAKTPQIMLFQYSDLLKAAEAGDRRAWSTLDTTFKMSDLHNWSTRNGATGAPSYAAAAGYALSSVNAVVGKLGKPIGIANYKPYQSIGEDYLPNFLGMIGLPIEMVPEFPTDAKTVLLTEDAKFDPQIVSKIKAHLLKGGTVIITSGLLKALQGNAPNQIGQLAEISLTGNTLSADHYQGPFGMPGGPLPHNILMPEISFMTNDAWPEVRLTANGNGAPLLFQDHYANGLLYILDIPDNPFDLYDLPQPVLTSLRRYLLRGFPVQFDAPSQVSFFAYDNNSFVAESFRDHPANVVISLPGAGHHLRNLATGAVINGQAPPPIKTPFGPPVPQPPATEFHITVQPHSFVAFAAE
ncbi:MAG: hypothetical protein KGN79_13295 [Acidobacteriota bacterium]|nr:hypothetical protein [Acidobacteriota bacterium]